MNRPLPPENSGSDFPARPSTAGIVIERISKRFPTQQADLWALRDVSFEAKPGEFLVLVGPSGSGKTTLLRIIAGLEEPSSGAISIGGKAIDRLAPQDREVAMSFQEHSLYPHMTVFENLAFGLKLRKVPSAEIARRVAETAELLGLSGLLDRPPRALSGGERQRVSVGRAVIVGSKVLLMDEPLSNLDTQLRAKTRRDLVRLHQRLKTTTIYVTHDQTEAMSVADRIVVIRSGVVQQVGRPMDIYHEPANVFVAGFVGSPAMNFFKGKPELRGNRFWFIGEGLQDAERLTFQLPDWYHASHGPHLDGVLLAGFRPESVRLSIGNVSAVPSLPVIRAKVEGIEPLGWETHLFLSTGTENFVARVLDECAAKVNDSVSVTLETRRMRLFDAGTGNAITGI